MDNKVELIGFQRKYAGSISGEDYFEPWLETLRRYTEQGNVLYHQCIADLEPVLGRKRAKESARFFKTYNSQIQADNKKIEQLQAKVNRLSQRGIEDLLCENGELRKENERLREENKKLMKLMDGMATALGVSPTDLWSDLEVAAILDTIAEFSQEDELTVVQAAAIDAAEKRPAFKVKCRDLPSRKRK